MLFFGNYKFTFSAVEHKEDNTHANNVSLMYKLKTSDKDSDDLSIGSGRDRGRSQRELTNNKNIEGRHHVRNRLRYIFGFPEQ